ncbi:hypothetical protein ACWDUC_13965 [Streptomyces tricolor]
MRQLMSMSEWIDPRYEELVTAWKRAQQPESRRAFIVPPRG